MNGEVTQSSEVLDGIEVTHASDEREEKVKVHLLSTYTQEDLPVDNTETARTEKLKTWSNLDKLKPVMIVDDSIKVSSLIGANCVHALEPRELISSQNGDPYAFKTLLGCCFVGPMINQIKAGKFDCNRIMFTSADVVNHGSH